MKFIFTNKNFALSSTFITRFKGTQKWPILSLHYRYHYGKALSNSITWQSPPRWITTSVLSLTFTRQYNKQTLIRYKYRLSKRSSSYSDHEVFVSSCLFHYRWKAPFGERMIKYIILSWRVFIHFPCPLDTGCAWRINLKHFKPKTPF